MINAGKSFANRYILISFKRFAIWF